MNNPFPIMLEPKHHALLEEVARRELPSADGVRLCFQVLALAGAIDRDCAMRLAPKQLSEAKFVLLFLLHGQPDGLPPHELATRAGVTRATITGLVDGLERDGFVERQGGQADRRKIAVMLTTKGRAMAGRLFKEHAAWIGSLFDGLTGAEQRQLGGLLTKVWRGTDAGRVARQEGQE